MRFMPLKNIYVHGLGMDDHSLIIFFVSHVNIGLDKRFYNFQRECKANNVSYRVSGNDKTDQKIRNQS